MRRLVYSPSIKCWIKTDTGTIDLSPYIVNCSISRKIDDISSAELEFRNPKIIKNGKPKFMFTDHEVDGKNLPVFHPMDPITIVLERIQGKPIQVFTGYCDSTPDIQLFPGTAKIKASCTLKRLLYTYWDPALPFVAKFMQEYGWALDKTSGVANKPDAEDDTGKPVNKLNDSSIANMLYATLNEVGGWDDKNIFIQELPLNLVPMVTKLFDEIVKDNESLTKEVGNFINDIIGAGRFGSALDSVMSNNSGIDTSSPTGLPQATEKQRVNTIRSIAQSHNIPPEFVLAVALVETELLGDDSMDEGDIGWFQWQSAQSYVGKPNIDFSKATDLAYSTDKFCQAAKFREKYKDVGPSYAGWARSIQLNPSSINGVESSDLGPYVTGIPTGNARFSNAQFPGFVERAKKLLDKHK